jgi:hypothetical protein
MQLTSPLWIQPYIGVRMTGTIDFGYHVYNHSSHDSRWIRALNQIVPDFHSRAVGSVVGKGNE